MEGLTELKSSLRLARELFNISHSYMGLLRLKLERAQRIYDGRIRRIDQLKKK